VTSDISQGSEGDDIITCIDAIPGFEVTFLHLQICIRSFKQNFPSKWPNSHYGI